MNAKKRQFFYKVLDRANLVSKTSMDHWLNTWGTTIHFVQLNSVWRAEIQGLDLIHELSSNMQQWQYTPLCKTRQEAKKCAMRQLQMIGHALEQNGQVLIPWFC